MLHFEAVEPYTLSELKHQVGFTPQFPILPVFTFPIQAFTFIIAAFGLHFGRLAQHSPGLKFSKNDFYASRRRPF